MRESGVRDVLIYCADRWPDHVRLSDIEPGFVCTALRQAGLAATSMLEIRLG
jgi:hypothetical protein